MPKARNVLQAARALAQKLGAEKLGARLGVTARTVQRWIRNGIPDSRKDDVRAAAERSDRARRIAVEVWRERRTSEAREEIFKQHRLVDTRGEAITGHVPGGRRTLAAMIKASDPAWLEFLAAAEAEGRSLAEVKKEWFSPNAKSGGGGGKKKKRKKPGRAPKKNIGKRKGRKHKKGRKK